MGAADPESPDRRSPPCGGRAPPHGLADRSVSRTALRHLANDSPAGSPRSRKRRGPNPTAADSPRGRARRGVTSFEPPRRDESPILRLIQPPIRRVGVRRRRLATLLGRGQETGPGALEAVGERASLVVQHGSEVRPAGAGPLDLALDLLP